MLIVPSLWTTEGSLVHLFNVKALTLPPMEPVPATVKGGSVSKWIVDSVHVLCEILNVSVRSSVLPALMVAWTVTALFCVTPLTSSVVAEALGAAARAVRALTAMAAMAILFRCFICVSFVPALRRGLGTH
jgi:hypothetical protein